MKESNNEPENISDEEIMRLMEQNKNRTDALNKILKSLNYPEVDKAGEKNNNNKNNSSK